MINVMLDQPQWSPEYLVMASLDFYLLMSDRSLNVSNRQI